MDTRRIPTTCLVTAKGTSKINQYRRERKLHSSKDGTEVMLYTDEVHRRRVVVKAVRRNNTQDKVKAFKKKVACNNDPPSSQQSIEREISILKACQHPCHVQLLEVIDDVSKDRVYLALEYLSGGQVQWEENGRPTLMVDQCRRVLRDVIIGLEYLHYHGIIHRDIKPANIMWCENRTYVKIIDYGISHFSESRLQVPSSHMDVVRQCPSFKENDLLKVRGTGYFFAPEVVWYPSDMTPFTSCESIVDQSSPTTVSSSIHRPPVTEAVDIWCLGVTAFCFFFGRFPFNPPGGGQHNLNKEILERDWPVASTMCADDVPTGGDASRDVDGHVLSMLNQMLQKDPTQRIELSALKRHNWILDGIHQPEAWLALTSPSKLYARPTTWFRRSLSALQNLLPGVTKS
ncbi:kinase-like domain-containing protein [Mucidula mucida]|nr:kinase-like domain-containing protein [Mucidula mucida]